MINPTKIGHDLCTFSQVSESDLSYVQVLSQTKQVHLSDSLAIQPDIIAVLLSLCFVSIAVAFHVVRS